MSYAVDAPPMRSLHLLETESYVLSDPQDPATPTVSRGLSVVLNNRAVAFRGFFVLNALASHEVWNRLLPEACITLLPARGIHLARPAEVMGYLLKHPDLVRAVLLVAEKAKEGCGPGDEVAVERYQDPEIHDEYLVVYLRRQVYGEDTMSIIEPLGEEAARAVEGSSGWLLVTTDFRRPQAG